MVVPTKIIIAKLQIISIITCAFGVSSNGRTRDFGSLYHGSNPCAPTNIQTPLLGRFNIVFCGHGSQSATTVAGSTMSRFDKHSAIKSSGMPRRR